MGRFCGSAVLGVRKPQNRPMHTIDQLSYHTSVHNQYEPSMCDQVEQQGVGSSSHHGGP
jgi:hypothetical protein